MAPPRSGTARVPRTTQVKPGVAVNIVLKADQPTGRQVSGTVRDILTRGDHPRGIKVRLADGRIGRVQSLASPDLTPASATGSAAVSDPDVGHESTTPATATAITTSGPSCFHRSRPARGGPRHVRDARLDDPPEPAAEQIDLAAYIVPAKQRGGKGKGKGKGKGNKAQQPPPQPKDEHGAQSDNQVVVAEQDAAAGNPAAHHNDEFPPRDVNTATSTCPVCNAFQGDEAAVSHHVASHFE